MKSLLGLLLIPFLLAADPKCSPTYTYQADLKICWRWLKAYAPWSWAKDDCSQELSGNLPSIHSGYENALYAQIFANITGDTRWWLGAQKGADGQWKWTDGTPFDFQRFAQTNDTQSDCAYLDAKDQQWKLELCKQQSQWFSFVCVKLPIPSISQP
ncbi:unnamed protein product, partial [Mesorhabditis belari]|uniref:C-type lectin domain-containing protein n=1 Tax=Mesorhabditis belari TaxID=2138241 RepID=A0AAF3EEP8_9BILA